MTNNISPWEEKEKADWLSQQEIKRSYIDDVVSKIEKLKDNFEALIIN